MGRADELMPVRRGEETDYGFPPLTDELRELVEVTERTATADGRTDVRVLVMRPKASAGPLPVLMHFHGGAFCHLSPDDFAGIDAGTALSQDVVVVSVDYRLAPEHPFPAGPEDCYTALLWTVASAGELGVDVDRLVVSGGSAGGALSAAVALMARDRNGPRLAAQALTIPVTDDRLRTPSMRQYAQSPGFSGTAAEGMWLHYLGEDRDVATTSPYAAPARATDLSGLPPAIVVTHGLDPLRDEGIEYALALLAAGVAVELINIPGSYHGAPPEDPGAVERGYAHYARALAAALRPAGHAEEARS
jgi:acetyl esterase/lipase